MKKFCLLLPFIYITSAIAQVDDLNIVYQKALANDPSLKSSMASFRSTKENYYISRADLLPNLTSQGTVTRERDSFEGMVNDSSSTLIPSKNVFYSNANSFTLSLTQPVFNYSKWKSVQSASLGIKQAEATYLAAEQDLIYRTAVAYFNILKARDVLRVTLAEKKSLARQLSEETERYNVGVIPLTNVQEAKANYDSVVSQEISNNNDIANAIEKLREIIGTKPNELASLKTTIPLLSPEPNNVESWMEAAEKQNYTLLSSHYATLVAHENVKIQGGGHLPTLDMSGNYQYLYNDNASGLNDFSRSKAATLNLNLNFPIYQGGATSAKTRQANDLYQQAIAQQELTHRQTISQTRQAFLGVVDAISKIKSDKQAIISNQSAYDSMVASYKYGIRTMSDLLTSEQNLYSAQKDYANDEYNYIVQILSLKQSAGILGLDDLNLINAWLQKTDEAKNLNKIGKNNHAKNNKKETSEKPREAKQTTKKTGALEKKDSNDSDVSSLNPKHYVLQISASSNKNLFDMFKHKYCSNKNKRNNFDKCKEYHYLAVNQSGKTVYKIVTNDFASLSQATKEKAKLSESLGKNDIWIRTVGSVQKELGES